MPLIVSGADLCRGASSSMRDRADPWRRKENYNDTCVVDTSQLRDDSDTEVFNRQSKSNGGQRAASLRREVTRLLSVWTVMVD